jgi:hypothetical protein
MDRKYLTWDEIKKEYPDMWISINEPKYSEEHEFLGGFVIAASQDKKTALKEKEKFREQNLTSNVTAFYYTGEVSIQLLTELKLRILRSLDTI